MKITGTNTDKITSVMAIIGAVICPIAFATASGTDKSGSSSITRSVFSTTIIASSTTMPITRTMDNREIVFAEMPNGAMKMNVPISETGTAIAGINVARHVPKDR